MSEATVVETSKAAAVEKRNWTHILLTTARMLYLIIAAGCLIVAGFGLAAVLLFQIQKAGSPVEVPIPPAHVATPARIDMSIVDARLVPPESIRLVVLRPIISNPLKGDEILGYFDASASNGLVAFPNDFEILSGQDISLFERVATIPPQKQERRAALRATPLLVQQINGALPSALTLERRDFELMVMARDALGNRSEPQRVQFSISYGPTPAVSQQPALPQSESPQPLTALQALARDIALHIDPNRSPAYFELYQKALEVPRSCGAADNDSVFLTNYRQAFEHVRAKGSPINQAAFNTGICQAWRAALEADNRERARVEAERNAVAAKNQSARMESEVKRFEAGTYQKIALSVLGGAIAAFMSVALFLAFLSIENHSKAVRQAVEELTKHKRDSGITQA